MGGMWSSDFGSEHSLIIARKGVSITTQSNENGIMTPVLAFVLSKKVCRDVIAVDIGKNRQTTGLVRGAFHDLRGS